MCTSCICPSRDCVRSSVSELIVRGGPTRCESVCCSEFRRAGGDGATGKHHLRGGRAGGDASSRSHPEGAHRERGFTLQLGSCVAAEGEQASRRPPAFRTLPQLSFPLMIRSGEHLFCSVGLLIGFTCAYFFIWQTLRTRCQPYLLDI